MHPVASSTLFAHIWIFKAISRAQAKSNTCCMLHNEDTTNVDATDCAKEVM
jgi:hypothetical protein